MSKTPPQEHIYDVAVIGGGASGMMAAGRAAELGAKVLLIEKNETLGKKLLITGGGRCNVTNAEFDTKKLLEKFKDDKKFLFSPFSKFAVEDTLSFFHGKNMPTKVEKENRVFPLSNSAQTVFDVLVKYMKDNKVTIMNNSSVKGFVTKDGVIDSIMLRDKKTIKAKTYILATGGKSRPETGSTGDGFNWLADIGHTIIEPSASLVPIKIQEQWVHTLSGVTIENIKLTTYLNNKPQARHKGKMLFTHFGVSGPMILNMSKDVGELLKYGDVSIFLDLLPHLDTGILDKKFQEVLKIHQNKKIKNSISEIVPQAIAPVLIQLSGVNADKPVNILTKDERLSLVRLMKNLPLTVTGLMGEDKAIITSGGVDLREIDWKTMASMKYPNLFIIGDVLNIDRPSGGYSLQLCWTTGYLAGTRIY
jgi:predicted Rossmann fold flavoprotein